MSESLFDALDLPPEVQQLQDAYWRAKREWEALSEAYHRVLHDLLAAPSSANTAEATGAKDGDAGSSPAEGDVVARSVSAAADRPGSES